METSHESLLKIKRETLLILKERGFTIPEEESDILNNKMSLYDFRNMYTSVLVDTTHPLYEYFKGRNIRTAMSNIYNKGRHICAVYFADSGRAKNLSKEESEVFCNIIINKEVDSAIIVSMGPSSKSIDYLCTSIVKKKDEDKNHGVFIQHFMDDELMYNPLNHVMVPKHRIMSKDEVKELKEVDKITPGKLPQISALDPIAKRLGARPGDILEIMRDILIKQTTLIEQEISYRAVFMPHTEKRK